MKRMIIKSICLSYLTALMIFFPLKTVAQSHEWIAVPNNQYGEQLWDKKSLKKNQEGFFQVLSMYIPKSRTNITSETLYTMDIDCSKKFFRDVAVGAKNFNEFENKNSEWKDPNGDKLILGVIDQVCASIN